jgi:hypothetical protein
MVVMGYFEGTMFEDNFGGSFTRTVLPTGSFAQITAVEASQTSHADLRHNAAREVTTVSATMQQTYHLKNVFTWPAEFAGLPQN